MSQPPPQFNYASYIPVSHPQVMYPVQTTQRNYILVPSPNPGSQFAFQGQEAFKQKIDYSKIQLRKTDSSLDGMTVYFIFIFFSSCFLFFFF